MILYELFARSLTYKIQLSITFLPLVFVQLFFFKFSSDNSTRKTGFAHSRAIACQTYKYYSVASLETIKTRLNARNDISHYFLPVLVPFETTPKIILIFVVDVLGKSYK